MKKETLIKGSLKISQIRLTADQCIVDDLYINYDNLLTAKEMFGQVRANDLLVLSWLRSKTFIK